MAKHQNSSDECICKKIFNATLNPAFEKLCRTPKNNAPNLPLPASPVDPTAKAHAPHIRSVALHTPSSTDVIPVGFNHQAPAESLPEKEKPAKVLHTSGRVKNETKVASGSGANSAAQEKHKHKVDMAPPENLVMQSHGQGAKAASRTEPAKIQTAPPPKPVFTKEDTFSEFIDRVKKKIRTPSNIGGVNRQDSFNDKVSSYISRAKKKLRSTSSIGGGKSVTFIREE